MLTPVHRVNVTGNRTVSDVDPRKRCVTRSLNICQNDFNTNTKRKTNTKSPLKTFLLCHGRKDKVINLGVYVMIIRPKR